MATIDYKEKYEKAVQAAMLAKQDTESAVTVQTLEEIFPELRESEDERIRKAIINVFASHKDYEVFFGASVEDILAWLEKQGEQKSIDDLYDAMDIAVAKCFEQGEQKPIKEHNVCDFCEDRYGCVNPCPVKLIEQKPAEDVDLPEFESYLCLMFQKFRAKGMCTNGEIIDYVKEHSQKLRDILVKPDWSEEDGDIRDNIIRDLKRLSGDMVSPNQTYQK